MFSEKAILIQRCKNINLVKKILDKILSKMSNKENYVFIINPINEMSLDLIYEGAQPKPHTITLQTEKRNILGGYILAKPDEIISSRPVFFKQGDRKLYFMYSENDHTYLPQNNATFRSVRALTTKSGRFVTSDLDILMICGKGILDLTPISLSEGMGAILNYEYKVSQDINKVFTNLLVEAGAPLSDIVPLIQHGPFCRYKKTKLEDIYFPLTVYHPIEGKKVFGSELSRKKSIEDFFDLCASLEGEGYHTNVHENWCV